MDTIEEEYKRTDITVKFAEETHKYISDYIKHADQKAGFIFAYCTTAIVYLYQKGAAKSFLASPQSAGIAADIAFVALLSFGIAVFRSIFTLLPRYESSSRTASSLTCLGYIYWETITSCYKQPFEYSKAILALAPKDLLMAKLEHFYELALVSKMKHHHLNKGIIWSVIGVVSTILYLGLE